MCVCLPCKQIVFLVLFGNVFLGRKETRQYLVGLDGRSNSSPRGICYVASTNIARGPLGMFRRLTDCLLLDCLVSLALFKLLVAFEIVGELFLDSL